MSTMLVAMGAAGAIFAGVCRGYCQGWFEGEATIPIANITPEQARTEAFNRAREQALQVAGVEYTVTSSRHEGEDPRGYFDKFVRFTGSRASGLIVEIDTLLDDQAFQTTVGKRQSVHHVKISARIQPTLVQPDPGFTVEMKLNRTTYHVGDSLVITLKPTQDCFVTIINLYGNDSLRVILPNELWRETRLQGGVEMTVPPPGAIWDLPLMLPPEETSGSEALLVVATRKNIPFPGLDAVRSDRLLAFGDALIRLNRWLADISRDQRADDYEFYTIVK